MTQTSVEDTCTAFSTYIEGNTNAMEIRKRDARDIYNALG